MPPLCPPVSELIGPSDSQGEQRELDVEPGLLEAIPMRWIRHGH
jgi:hypothetical protein